MRMLMMMTLVVIVMTILTFLFNLQIQLSAAVSSAIFGHVHVMKVVKKEECFTKSQEMLHSEELNHLGKRILTVLKSLLLVCHCFTEIRVSAKNLNLLRT